MLITRAREEHIQGINELVKQYALLPITKDFINPFDIAVVAIDGARVVGFLWCGIMANKTVGYIDYYTIDVEYSKKNVATDIGKKFVSVCKQKGLKNIFGVIAQGPFIEKSVSGAIKIGMQVIDKPFALVTGEPTKMCSYMGVS